MPNTTKKRDKYITKQIHKLFWQSFLIDKSNLFIGYTLRIIAFLSYNVLIPLVAALSIQAIIENNTQKLTNYVLLFIGLAITYLICWSLGGIAISKNAVTGLRHVQNTLFSNYLNKDYDFYNNTHFGSLGSQATRIVDASNRYGELVTLSIPKQIVIVTASLAVIAYNSLLLAIITAISMLLILSFTIFSSSWRLKYRRQVNEHSNKLAGYIGDSLSHGTTVKSFSNQEFELKRIQNPLNNWLGIQYKSWNSGLITDIGRVVLYAIATIVLLLVSAKLYKDGSISISILVLIQLYVLRLTSVTFDIAEIIKRYEEAMGSAYQPVKTMLINNNILDPKNPKKILKSKSSPIKFNNISYKYPESKADQLAIMDFALNISKGEKIGVVGFSGSGKTTLSKLIMRFMDVTKGNITINNIDIKDITQKNLRDLIAYVPQEPLLFHRSIKDNILYGNPSAKEPNVLKVAKMAYIDEFVKDLPNGFNTLVGERGVKLSGGQRQRIAIARALLKDSPILVLDEATSALDSKSEQYIQDALWKLMKDKTALVIAHRLSTIQKMDRIIVIDKGKIVQNGTHKELLKQKGIYADLWGHQSGGYIITNPKTDTK